MYVLASVRFGHDSCCWPRKDLICVVKIGSFLIEVFCPHTIDSQH